jgi:hypothetical protein
LVVGSSAILLLFSGSVQTLPSFLNSPQTRKLPSMIPTYPIVIRFPLIDQILMNPRTALRQKRLHNLLGLLKLLCRRYRLNRPEVLGHGLLQRRHRNLRQSLKTQRKFTVNSKSFECLHLQFQVLEQTISRIFPEPLDQQQLNTDET